MDVHGLAAKRLQANWASRLSHARFQHQKVLAAIEEQNSHSIVMHSVLLSNKPTQAHYQTSHVQRLGPFGCLAFCASEIALASL